ncbi:MAG: FitA-like ribbon-helix-helix domain-containing protein [Phycicoccus sp.]
MYSACMVALQIRDVPDDVRDALVERARESGQSLQGFLLGVVVREASFTRNRSVIADLASWTSGTGVSPGDALAALDAARGERPGMT